MSNEITISKAICLIQQNTNYSEEIASIKRAIFKDEPFIKNVIMKRKVLFGHDNGLYFLMIMPKMKLDDTHVNMLDRIQQMLNEEVKPND